MKLRLFQTALLLVTETMPPGVAGDAHGPVIRIRADLWARGDAGLLQHELEHVRQFWRLGIPVMIVNGLVAGWLALQFGSPLLPLQAGLTVGIFSLSMHSILYLVSRGYREQAEVDAYRTQMRFPDGKGGQLTLDGAATRLAGDRYKLGITIDQARALLAN